MAEVVMKACDGCHRYEKYLKNGLHRINITREDADSGDTRTKSVLFCDRCLERGDTFTFDRGFETREERIARREAADSEATPVSD